MNEEKAAYAAERNSKLPLSTQDKIIAQLTELVYTLTDRLKPVLVPTEEVSDKIANETVRTPLSPLGEQLDANNVRITKVNNRLSSLLERLEC